MLKECAPGYSWDPKTHHVWVGYNGKRYHSLPKGGHDSKGEIERGWVQALARQLGIVECANRYFPGLNA
jgi:hypothetical protein